MLGYLIALIASFIIVYLTMPFFMKLAKRYSFTDKPTERKKHKGAIPLVGGLGMFVGFSICYLFFVHDNLEEKISIVVAAFLVLSIGLVDDYYKSRGKEFKILPRVVIQLIAANIIYFSGIVFKGVTNPFDGHYILLPILLQYILTITWIFGVTTVVNWSDGMDGLAGGITSISATTLFVVALAMHQYDSAIMCIILVGCILAFLRYNRPPAKIFMGDSGANFLGFLLAIIALDGAFKQATIMSILIPFLALGVPIFDNLFVVFKRFTEGKPVYQADRSQIHYRLQRKGLSTKQVLLCVCLISGVLSLISILIVVLKL
ncbi:MraY family glycosyltransferase [Clostridium fallax]|uniref:UDP-N-acetylmuramyl pentapeptide phosphotransferase/UDP-N-acetylglucosamine-1-phosphate transferase n=1 Tax=Clostridium fallax TaxID=1533 RepID=A0A1M4U5L5_9CLOT|nr:MraY family glycosyltransferase [Clostridium fallax]SHE51978.1 UDP-N-acetylmuramyl pentapeptide phosphotransferase/UDP-N-acetylglucosamine-1-phosphate transferase [Clostridium fallax]SQB06089.1 undecaprenyl-phosphate N-acetylglucosaminyltransferase [Clostridium fallax]